MRTARTPVIVEVEEGGQMAVAVPTERDDVGWSYEVTVGGNRIGIVARRLVTRERRTKGRRYVDARWQSPAWCYQHEGDWKWHEVDSLRYGITRLARE